MPKDLIRSIFRRGEESEIIRKLEELGFVRGGTGGDAVDVDFTPAGSIEATNVQAAIEEVAAEAASGGIPDGDKGDIVVTDSGATWTFDPSVVTAAGRALIDDANAGAQRTTLGLGTAALAATGDFDAAGDADAAQAAAEATAAAALSAHEADTTTHGISAFGAALVDDADAAAARATLGLGTAATQNTGAFDAAGAAAAAYAAAAADLATHEADTTTHGISAYGASLVDDVDAAAARTTLGLGTLATQSGTFSGTHSGTSSGTNTGDQTLGSLGGQPLDAELTAIAGLTSAADKGIQFTGSGTAGTFDLTAAAKTVLDDATVAAMVDTLGGASSTGTGGLVRATSPTLVTPALGTPTALVGTNITGTAAGLTAGTVTTNANLTGPVTSVGNATTIADAELAAIAGLTSAADRLPYFTGSGTASLATFTAAARTVLDDATVADMVNTLGGASSTGTGGIARATSPTFVTPTLGAASATSLALTSGTVTNVPTPSASTDAANKAYVDNAIAGLKWKAVVRAATTAPGTLASSFENGDTVDGVTLATGDRILIKDQSAGAENGIYTVNASGAPTRATDADSGAELVGATVVVTTGTANADKAFVCTNDSITIGSTAVVFVNFASTLTGALLAANNLSDLANAATAVNNLGGATSTGTGGLVRASSPTLVTPNLGTPSTLVATNATGTAAGLTAGTVTTNANLTGPVTSVGNATTIADAELAALAGLTSAADSLPYFTGSGTAALATFTSAGRALVDDADATAQRSTLGLGTAATQAANATPTASNVPIANGSGKLAAGWLTEVLALADLSDVTAKTGTGTTVVMSVGGTLTGGTTIQGGALLNCLADSISGPFNGLAVLEFDDADGDEVNFFRMLAAGSGDPAVELGCEGDDGDIWIRLAPKGGGRVMFRLDSVERQAVDVGISGETQNLVGHFVFPTGGTDAPDIDDFQNSKHNHQDDVGGGTLERDALEVWPGSYQSHFPAGTTNWEAWQVPGVLTNTALGNSALAANILYAYPFPAVGDRSIPTIDRLGVEIVTGSSGNIRVGIYEAGAASTGYYPTTLVVESGALSSTSTGVVAASISQALTPGKLYWMAFLTDATPTVRQINNQGQAMLGFPSTGGTAPHWGCTVSQTYGTMPSTFPSSAALQTGAPRPVGLLRYAA